MTGRSHGVCSCRIAAIGPILSCRHCALRPLENFRLARVLSLNPSSGFQKGKRGQARLNGGFGASLVLNGGYGAIFRATVDGREPKLIP
jgi:hypothetical protein